MQRHGYANWKLIDEEVRQNAGEQGLLGKIPDGTYECQIVSIQPIARHTFELVLKNNQHIHVSEVGYEVKKILEWATGRDRPAGWTVVATFEGGALEELHRET